MNITSVETYALDENTRVGAFEKQANYFYDMDYVEYVTKDCPSVSERIDEYLTIIWDLHRTEIVGFKLKGFRHFFNTRLKPVYDLNDELFLQLSSALEILVSGMGEQVVEDAKRKWAYHAAHKVAEQNDAKIFDIASLDAA